MAGKANTFSKKTIIAIATIIVLLLIAGISVGIFLADKGKTEAVDNNEVAENRIDNENKDDNEQTQDPSAQNPENQGNENNQTQNTDGNQTENNNQIANNNRTNNNTNNNTANNTQTAGTDRTTNNGVTTETNVNEVGETTITRIEEGEEKVVAKKFWDWWNPMSVVVASTTANINAEKPEIIVEKSATTEAGENLVYVGEQIKYTINVTNNSKKDVENIEVTDRIPENTTFASIDNEGTTITKENDVIGVKWVVSIPAGETKTVEFTVTVNPTMLDEDGEKVKTKGFINNKAIANGEESNEVKTSIIKSKKTSAIIRDTEQVEKAKIGDTIIYYISVENTGDIAGKTTITDYIPEGTELQSSLIGANITTDEKGTKLEWKDIDVPAGKTTTVFFMVKVTNIDGVIENVATVGGKDTNKEDVGTADIEIIKNVTDIKRNGNSIGKDSKVQAGDVIEYELIVTNKGSENLTDVTVTDELEGIELTDGKWIIGDLASKESKILKAKYTVQYEKDINGNADKTITNYAVVAGTSVPVIPEEIPEEVSDDDDVTTPVEDTPNLEIEKESTAVNGKPIVEGKTKVRAGDIIEYTITVKNTGNVELKDVIVTDNNTVKIGDTTYTVEQGAENVVIKTIPSIAVGETAEAIKAYYTVTENDVKEAGNIYNLATATSGTTTDEDDDDNVVVNENKTITAKKIWDDNSNQDGIRPDTIELTLYADGVEYKDEKTNQTVKVTITPEQKADNEWSYIFEGLPTYNKDGKQIEYTIVETNIGDEYTTTYSSDNLTVTNKHVPYTVDINVTKVWEDNSNQDGIRAAEVTVNLKKGDTVVGEAKVLSEANNWTGAWEGLPKYENGTLIEYKVEEIGEFTGYTVNSEKTNVTENVYSYQITNTHEVEKTSVTINKNWNDNGDQDGKRPDTITVKLLADGVQATDDNNNNLIATITPDNNGNWTYTFTNLDKYKAGKLINYTISEDNVEEYTTSTPTSLEETTDGYVGTITNTHTPETTSITVNKKWEDNDNQDGKRPDSVKLILKANGTKVMDATVTESDKWSATFDNLPVYLDGTKITYAVDEETVADGYSKSVTGYTVTNTHEVEKTSVTVNKEWNDSDNQDGIRPETISVSLKNKGNVVGTAVLTENNNWSATFKNLPKYENKGNVINYEVVENTIVGGYTVTIDNSTKTITNTHVTDTTEIPAVKVWNDNENQDGIRPTNVTLILKADGTEVDRATVTADDNWSKTFKNLPVNKNGKKIIYTVDEETVASGYEKTIEGMTVTNTHAPETTKITVNKEWKDNDNQDGKRPDSVTLILKANGTEVKRATVTANDNWSATFDNLPVKEKGIDITYTVDEETVASGYEKTIEGMTVTNTHAPETTKITVNKEWKDNDNQDGKRPDSVKLILKANGTIVKEATVTEGNNWSATFNNLPVYLDGTKINYTVDEEEVADGYSKSVTGYTVTNTHEVEKTSVTVNKEWNDSDNQDGIRPNSVSITLKATIRNSDGKEENVTMPEAITNTITLNKENKWTYTWSGLDKNKAGQEIKYTVVENNVKSGYTASISSNPQVTNGITVTNSHEVEKTSVTINKKWEDNGNQDGKRPDKITVKLLANGVQAKDDNNNDLIATITPDDNGNWTYTWSGLNKYENGNKINYTVSEDNVDEYSQKTPEKLQETSNGYVGTITNSHTPATIEIPVTKIWKDNDYVEARAEKITVELYENGSKTNKKLDITAATEWKDSFKDLPKYKNGKEIEYTVQEKAIEGYITESITGDSEKGFTITNKYKNVIVNKNVVKSVTEQEKYGAKLDVVFVIDTSGSMDSKVNDVKKAQTMVNALNSTMATILENENNRVGIVGYSDDYGKNKSYTTEILGLDHYTAEGNKFITLSEVENHYSSYIQANATNSAGKLIENYRYVEGGTYTQAGIKDGAELLTSASNTEGRIPVIILLTDGEPTRSTSQYDNVGDYVKNDSTYGNGSSSTSASAYYTIMSGKYYKNEVNKKYATEKNPNIANFFTIGIGMNENDLYANTLLYPDKSNVEKCSKAYNRSKAKGIYNLMKNNYENKYGKNTFKDDKLNYYSYSDGTSIGDMDEEKLKNILMKTMDSIYTYVEEKTYTTNIDVDTAIIELEHLDTEKKIGVKINGENAEYTVQELIDSNVVTKTGSKYYMDLNTDMFKNKKTIEITYYQVSLKK